MKIGRESILTITEKQIHINICEYLRLQYPNLIFFSDASGLRVSVGLRIEIQKKMSGHKIPDLIILVPNSQYRGAFIEIKRCKDDLYLKSGKLKNDHVKSQEHTMILLRDMGYFAEFGIGFEHTIQMIERYLNT